MLLHLVSSMHTALTSGGAVHTEIQWPVSSSSQPNFNGAANIVLPCVPIYDQLGLLPTLHACIRLLLWWNVTYLSITETNTCLLASFTWLNVYACLYRWPISRYLYMEHDAIVQQNHI